MCFDKEYISAKPNLLDALKIPKCYSGHSFYNIFCFGSRIENAPKKGEIDCERLLQAAQESNSAGFWHLLNDNAPRQCLVQGV